MYLVFMMKFLLACTTCALGLFSVAQAQMTPAALEAASKKLAEQKAKAAAASQFDSSAIMMPHQENAQALGERIYNTWRLGMMRSDKTTWSKVTAKSRQNKVRNLIISQRGDFDRDFARMSQQQMPQLENFRFVGALAACQGKTLALTYVGRVQLQESKPEPCAFILRFVQEGVDWKFDQSSFISLQALPETLKRLEAKDVKVLQEQDGFHPYYSIPKTPALCGTPQLIGKVFVDCPGREVEMHINGISAHEFYNERRADVISGGLRRGNNTISYSFKDVAGEEKSSLGIGLFVMPETEGNQPVVVFEYILDAEDMALDGSFNFVISNEAIRAMNPAEAEKKPAPFRPVPLKATAKPTP